MSRFPGTTMWARTSAIALAVPALLTFVPGSAQATSVGEVPSAVRAVGWSGVSLPTATNYTEVSQGYWAGIGLTPEGKIESWGSTFQGSIDIPTSLDSKIVTKISQGYNHGLAQTSDGQLTTWGQYLDGANPENPVPQAAIPTEVAQATIVDFAAGYHSDLAVTDDGEVLAWGANTFGGLNVPASLDGKTVVDVATGEGGSVALTSDGKVTSWGGLSQTPSALDDENIVAISTGGFSALALNDDGKLFGWGSSGDGQLDIPSSLDGKTVTAFSMAGTWAMAATAEGDLLVWGNPERSQATPPAALTGRKIVDLQGTRYGALATYGVLTSDAQPQISGNAMVDEELTVTPGSYSVAPDSHTYQWNSDGQPISGATGLTYSPGAATVGTTITVTETALKDGWASATATSEPTDSVELAQFGGSPSTTFSTNQPRVGEIVTAQVTGSEPAADSYTYQWTCNDTDINEADGASYKTTSADLDCILGLKVTAIKAGYESIESKPVVGRVEPAYFGMSPSTKFSGAVRVGKTVTVRVTGSEPKADSYTYQWTRNGANISGARGTSYKPTKADLGRTLGLRVTALKAGYTPIDSTPAAGRVEVGATKLKVSVSSKVKRGKKLTVKVSGLAPRERYTIRMFGFNFATGKADSKGRINRKLKISSSAVPSKQTVKVIGSFTDRVGSDKTKITKK